MPRVPPECLALLTPVERVALRLGEALAGPLKRLSIVWSQVVVSIVAWLAVGRRLHVEGLEHLEGLGPRSRVVLVANHRSFFDFFIIASVTSWRSRLPRRSYFPVRAGFFYSSPLGAAVNLVLTGMSMFPPILREPSRAAFNKWSLTRTIELSDRPGSLVGLHPEGTRNKGPDPYDFLEAQPGVGKVVLGAAEGVQVVPVFMLGVTSHLHRELAWNWLRPRRHPVNVLFGPQVDLSDLRAKGSRPTTQKYASDRCLEAIALLAARERALREEAGVPPPPAPTGTTPGRRRRGR